MLLGIDVGGTFTDAVVLKNGSILAQAKHPTTHGKLLDGVLAVMDTILRGMDATRLERVALSTTIVTNALVEGKTDRVNLMLMTGPGMDYRGLLPAEPVLLSGYIDHRGREAAPPDTKAAVAAARDIGGIYAIAGKFSVRNPAHEQQVAASIRKTASPLHVSLSSEISGSLNFWRRTNSSYYNAAVWRRFGEFAGAVEEALKRRGIHAPVHILKADGGTMPLPAARQLPVEAIFTGPAASVLGIMALAEPDGEAVSLDVGGTTTDIALWRNGLPLFAQRGARIAGYPTSVQAFRLKSIGIGGDSFVAREADGAIRIGPERKGPAMAVGGDQPTLSDAMIVAGTAAFGDARLAAEAMRQVARPGETEAETAWSILTQAAVEVCRAIREMISEQASEPVYKVEDVIKQNPVKPDWVIGIGGAAPGLAPLVAEKLGCRCRIPENAAVANAVGAAVAKPTIEITLRADTSQGSYTVAELGLAEKLPARNMRREEVRELAARCLRERAAQIGVEAKDIAVVYEEEFNLIRGFSTTGKIITCRLQLKPGVLYTQSHGEGCI
ncbi:MAG: hydantoinase/oxoprolinase family protein [Negativicutes bacterium]|nr:hydantoinase/oxoprolinase family protein [Negativicutes bacterium]